jgi:MurNAc alpha-1-phosphate uridylyltransferase
MVIAVNKAMILAAGRGERMRPLTDTIPKPLVEVMGKPLIDWQLDWVAEAGIQDVVINSSYLAEKLEAHVTKRTVPEVVISREAERLETGGGIAKALPLLGTKVFFSLNSDVIMRDAKGSSALQRLALAWDDATMDVLMLLQPTEKAFGYEGAGDFSVDNGRLCRRGDAASAPYIFTGVQMIHPRFFKNAPAGAFSLNVLYNRGIEEGGWLDSRISYIIHEGDWLHVGDVAARDAAQERLLKAV